MEEINKNKKSVSFNPAVKINFIELTEKEKMRRYQEEIEKLEGNLLKYKIIYMREYADKLKIVEEEFNRIKNELKTEYDIKYQEKVMKFKNEKYFLEKKLS